MAYAMARRRGFKGTLAEWLISARGPGPARQKGDRGERGADGRPGELGERGLPGESVKGDRGERGPRGETGADGLDGINGWTPVSALEEHGDKVVMRIVDWAGGEGSKPERGLYVGPEGFVKHWQDATNLRGPGGGGSGAGGIFYGPPGPAGADGVAGPAGPAGADGPTEARVIELIEESMAETEVDAWHAQLTASGNNIIKAPASGKALRLFYYSLHADPENADAVICGLRFGVAGTIFASEKLSQYGGIQAHSYKAGRSYVQGAVDEVLYGNLDGAHIVDANIDYEEVTP